MRRLTEQDKNVILDGCDLFGFSTIKYCRETNALFVFYDLTEQAIEVGERVLHYFEEKCPYYNWQIMSLELWNSFGHMPRLICVMDLCSWGWEDDE